MRISKCKECNSPAFSKGLCKRHQPKKSIKTKPKIINKDRVNYFNERVGFIVNEGLVCEECGDKLKGNISEVAHIISKSKNPEVEANKYNVMYLCGVHSNNSCHSKFDQSLEKRRTMKCFDKALDKFKCFEDKIINNTNEVQFMKKELDGRFKS